MGEQKAKAGSGEALESADQPHERRDEAFTAGTAELDAAPADRQPDLLAAHDQLDRDEHRDDLEQVSGAAGRQRQGGHAEEQHEDERKALLAEEFDQAAERFLVRLPEPTFDLDADAGCVPFRSREGSVSAVTRLIRPGLVAGTVLRRIV